MTILAALLLAQADPAAALDAELLASPSATAVLQKRCAEPIRAVVDRAARRPASPETRARLGVGAEERIFYRSVRLMCGGRVFSRAENWYLPGRLRPHMNTALLTTDTPFGVAIAEYAPARRTVSSERLSGGDVLRHRALVIGAPDRPLAEVVETYTTEALAGD